MKALTNEEKSMIEKGDYTSFDDETLVIIKGTSTSDYKSLNEAMTDTLESYKNGDIDLQDSLMFIYGDIAELIRENKIKLIKRK